MRNKPPYFRFRMKTMKESNCFEDISDLLTTVYGLDKNKNRQQNRTMPNIRVMDGSETRRHTAASRRVYGNQSQRRAPGENMANPSPSTLLDKSRIPEIESQGDYQSSQKSDLSNKIDDPGSIIVRIPGRRRNVFRVDTDTDTSNHVHSYMEERARRKALSGRIKVIPG